MKKLLFFYALLGVFTLQAQPEITWGEPYKQGSMSYLKEIVGYDENGFYAVEDKGILSSKTMLMKFDKNMNQVEEANINQRQKDGRVFSNVIAFPNQMYVVYTNYAQRDNAYSLFANKLNTKDMTVEPSSEETELCTAPFEKKMGAVDFNHWLMLSRDSSKLVVIGDITDKNRKEDDKYVFRVFSDDLTLLWEQKHTFPYQDRFFYFEDAVVSNEGNVYCVGRIATDRWFNKREGKPTYSYKLFYLSPNEEKPKEIAINVKDRFITDVKVGMADNGDIVCAGFYSENSTFNVEGVFSIILDANTHQVKQQSMKQIPISTIVENMTEGQQERLEKKEAKGKNVELYAYDLDRLLHKKDGGFMLIGEQYYVRVETVYTGRTTQTRYHYYFNDIIVVNVDNKGNIVWGEKIGKRQHSIDDGGHFSSYGMMIDADKLHFIYNDNQKNADYTGEGRPSPINFNAISFVGRGTLIVSLDSKGKETRKLLFTKDDSESSAIPRVSQQISDSELIMYFQRGGKRRFAKITF